VMKEGHLDRQGSFMKSHWKPCHAVVTSTGWLHLFPDKAKKASVHRSIALGECTVESGDVTAPFAIQITTHKKPGLFASGPTTTFVKATSLEEQQDFLALMQRLQAPQPALVAQPAPVEAAPVAQAAPVAAAAAAAEAPSAAQA